ncbi:TerC family protein [Geomonas anaerohicana]|uniref:TerC family protein n=1 Tax=Geomonas anaerohicana TaxID=2798583 RepID=A0ABS0YDT6_9BACT|nr:TerC family protein [Geomonas anaerohicana]MBJ6750460.1 TerC family protein [Geomonas anaerohicana]
MTNREMMWIAFAGIITVMFILDLFVFNRKSHEIGFREALAWTAVWVGLAMAFNVGVWNVLGSAKALEFLTGYIIEESLSVDNLFVFIMIFSYFKVSRAHQPKILKWGIIGALVMRGIFIVVGIELIERFHWMIYVFGAVLIYTGFKMAFGGDEEVHPEHNPLVRLVRRFVPITKRARGDHFFIRRRGIWAATPLFLTLVVVESTDVIFAVDSIPAVLAVTHDPFIVYSSNVFAIMGLRSLYYLLANVMEMFAHLKLGVSVILAFVGSKMLLSNLVEIPLQLSLGVIIGALTISILTSIVAGKRHRG